MRDGAAIEIAIIVEDALQDLWRNWRHMASASHAGEPLASIVASTRCWLVVAHAGARGECWRLNRGGGDANWRSDLGMSFAALLGIEMHVMLPLAEADN